MIVPTDGLRIKEKFWEILEAYSPDRLALYRLTFADVAQTQPEDYAETKEYYRRGWNAAKASGDFEAWFAESAARSEIDKLVISNELNNQLLVRLSPLHFQDRAVQDYLSRGSGFGFPYTKMSNIGPHAKKPLDGVVLPKPADDPVAELLVNSLAGRVSDSYCKELTVNDISVSQLVGNYENSEALPGSQVWGCC